ncbi:MULTISPECIES: FtsB family cell division protein [Streptomycetaceae]|uniref:Cell division protein FtsL n=1 Tax=Streptantibioticus cattleyicolor (strain ATCC 35852 / DSM 46488 / JCM 4925 / NBRC 14057 / NRRL 8057) TaxID=1003195 RepID=F8JZY9_STREN
MTRRPRPVPARTGKSRPAPARTGRARAARAPFVVLVVVLLATGLVSLLLLNAAINQGSFQLAELKKETTRLTDERQALQQEVEQDSAPGTLQERARRLGMVPGGTPALLTPDGSVRGVPGSASATPGAP